MCSDPITFTCFDKRYKLLSHYFTTAKGTVNENVKIIQDNESNPTLIDMADCLRLSPSLLRNSVTK
jgi:hypothetical protein